MGSRSWYAMRDDDVAPALLFVALAAFACLTPAQNDTWWHLRSGREMWESRSFLTMERFSFTAFGNPLQNHWWLSQLAFYALHSLGGALLLTIGAGASTLLAVWGAWRLCRGSIELRIVLLLFFVLATTSEWAVRPQVFSLALIVLVAHLIARDRIVWLPLVMLVWANAHAMVLFGVLMAGACALEALVWTRRRLVRDAAVTLACLLVPALSPLGWEYWPRVLATVSMSKTLVLQEYQPPFQVGDAPFWIALAALAALAAQQWSSLREHPREDRILLIASGALALAAATASRNVAFFAVIAAPVISRLWVSVPRRASRERPAGVLGYALVGAASIAAVVAVTLQWQGAGVRLGWRPMSAEAVRAVATCPAPTFNHLEDGGYLMWSLPERRVFVDSRMEAYPLELLRRSRAADLTGDYEALFQEYGINCAVVSVDSPLYERLVLDESMTLVHSDASRAVFARPQPG